MQQWFFLKDGMPEGPVNSAQLQALARRGTILPESQIRLGADGAWRRADTVQGLKFAPAVPLPGIPFPPAEPPPAARPALPPVRPNDRFAEAVAQPRRIDTGPAPSRVLPVLAMLLPAAALCGFGAWKWLTLPTTGQLSVAFSPAELPPGFSAKLNGTAKSAAEWKALTLKPGQYAVEIFDGDQRVKSASATVTAGTSAALALEIPVRKGNAPAPAEVVAAPAPMPAPPPEPPAALPLPVPAAPPPTLDATAFADLSYQVDFTDEGAAREFAHETDSVIVASTPRGLRVSFQQPRMSHAIALPAEAFDKPALAEVAGRATGPAGFGILLQGPDGASVQAWLAADGMVEALMSAGGKTLGRLAPQAAAGFVPGGANRVGLAMQRDELLVAVNGVAVAALPGAKPEMLLGGKVKLLVRRTGEADGEVLLERVALRLAGPPPMLANAPRPDAGPAPLASAEFPHLRFRADYAGPTAPQKLYPPKNSTWVDAAPGPDGMRLTFKRAAAYHFAAPTLAAGPCQALVRGAAAGPGAGVGMRFLGDWGYAYLFVSATGELEFNAFVGPEKRLTPLRPRAPAAGFKPGQLNELTATVRGRTIALALNGTAVGEVVAPGWDWLPGSIRAAARDGRGLDGAATLAEFALRTAQANAAVAQAPKAGLDDAEDQPEKAPAVAMPNRPPAANPAAAAAPNANAVLMLPDGPAGDAVRAALEAGFEKRTMTYLHRVAKDLRTAHPEAAANHVGFQYATALIDAAAPKGDALLLELAERERNPLLALFKARAAAEKGNIAAARLLLLAWDWSKPLPLPLYAELAMYDHLQKQNALPPGTPSLGAGEYERVRRELVTRDAIAEDLLKGRRNEIAARLNGLKNEDDGLQLRLKSLDTQVRSRQADLATSRGQQPSSNYKLQYEARLEREIAGYQADANKINARRNALKAEDKKLRRQAADLAIAPLPPTCTPESERRRLLAGQTGANHYAQRPFVVPPPVLK